MYTNQKPHLLFCLFFVSAWPPHHRTWIFSIIEIPTFRFPLSTCQQALASQKSSRVRNNWRWKVAGAGAGAGETKKVHMQDPQYLRTRMKRKSFNFILLNKKTRAGSDSKSLRLQLFTRVIWHCSYFVLLFLHFNFSLCRQEQQQLSQVISNYLDNASKF